MGMAGLVRGARRAALATACLAVVAGCGSGRAPSSPPAPSPAPSGIGAGPVWPAPPNPMERTVAAGLKPAPKEYIANHVHAHLDIFVGGKPVTVASGIGIQTTDPAVQVDELPDGSKRYGGIELCNDPCISPLHTHDTSGILHTESSAAVTHTLGEFFTEWGVTLDPSCVATYCSPATPIAVYVNGELTPGDPRAIQLLDQREIAIVIGTPPAAIPKTADFANA